jgi:hypothetical protein
VAVFVFSAGAAGAGAGLISADFASFADKSFVAGFWRGGLIFRIQIISEFYVVL